MAAPTTPEELLEVLKQLQGDRTAVDPTSYRYVIYARKSTDDKDKQTRSLADQILECEEYARDYNLKVIGKPIQESESAKEPDIRPKFRQMINDLKAGKYDGILAWHPDRLARNMKDAGEIIDLLDKGVIKDLKFKTFTFENNPSGKMLLGITFVLSKQYSDHLSESVSRGNKRSIEEGKYINKAKHGYYKDGLQRLQPDGQNFLLIKNVFRMRVEGTTLEEIAAYLNENGYQRWRSDGSRTTCKMTKQKVQTFMSDTIYTGVVAYGKYGGAVNLIESYGFTPAVTVPDFMAINRLTNKEQFVRLSYKHRKEENVRANLMRGMVICAECRDTMSAGITTKKITPTKQTNYYYFRCDTDDCPRYGKSVRAKYILNHVYSFLEEKPFSSKKAYEHFAQEMERVSAERIREAKALLLTLRTQKAKTEDRLLRMREFLLDEKDEAIKEAYRGDMKRAEDDLKKLSQNLEKAEKSSEIRKAAIPTYEEFLELMGKMPQILRSIKSMKDLDFAVRKVFLNFTVRAKNVEKSTLAAPFDELCALNVSNGGRCRT
jgi:site-specific DNA recombinase